MNQQAVTNPPALAELLAGSAGFVVVFTARWSPASQPLFRATTDELAASGVPVVAVDVDAYPNYADQFSVVSVPTVLVLVGVDERRRFVGATSPADVVDAVDALGLIAKKGQP